MFRDTVVVALGTAMSRLTGLLRVVVLGIVLGQTALADAFDGANNSPNSIYELLVGGVLAASLVPLFTRFHEDGDDDSTTAVVSTSLVVLVLATVVAVLAAPLVFRLYSLSPSDAVDADLYRRVGTALSRIFLVQIFFYGLTALGSAILNSRRRFFAAAWSPVLANVVTISLLLLIPVLRDGAPTLDDALSDPALFWLLTLSATGGIAAMGLVLVPAVRAAGVPLRFRPDFRHPAVRAVVRLSAWTFGYVATNQVALVVIKNLAQPGSGDQDAYSKAYTFFMLPHGLLAISVATTFVPELTRRVRSGDPEGFASRMSSGLRLITALTVPASVAMVILARPTIAAFLEHGNFGVSAVDNTARALAGFSVGLVGFSLYIFALRGFYAHEDTRTPFWVNVFENALNIVLALLLVGRHGVLGLGLAFAIAYMVSSVVALVLLHRAHRAVHWSSFLSALWRSSAAAAAMGAVVWVLERAVRPTGDVARVAEVLACTAAGLGVYLATSWIVRLPETRHLSALLPGRGGPRPAA